MLKYLLIVSLSLFSCALMEEKTNKDLLAIKYNMNISVDDNHYLGTGVLPLKDEYNLHIRSEGTIDSLIINTCHRYWEVKEKDYLTISKKHKRFFKWKTKLIIDKTQVKFAYSPTGMEMIDCPFEITVAEMVGGRNFVGFFVIQNPMDRLNAELHCNGEKNNIEGTGICQSKAGLYQRIVFETEVELLKDHAERCGFKQTKGKDFKFVTKSGKCVVIFFNSQESFKLYSVGF